MQQELDTANRIIHKYKICEKCLDRYIKTNRETVKDALKNDLADTKECWLCQGLLNEINNFCNILSESLKDYEYDSFLIGSKIDEDILQREEELSQLTDIQDFEPIKMQINREIGKKLEKKLQKTVDFEKPQIMAVVDTVYDVVNMQISSLFIYGRYKKYERGISQTRWNCKICRGLGCRKCDYTGKLYQNSVEELILNEILKLTKGSDGNLHGSGREDVDVLMLGNGRPFVIEVKNPKKRTIDLEKLKLNVAKNSKNKISIDNLKTVGKSEISRLKSAEFKKTYRVIIEGKKPLNKEKLNEVALILPGQTIKQFTPTRVAHRRANKIRERKIYSCKIESLEGTIASLVIETQSGTYIKELVSGDNGKTKPNISEMLKTPCSVKELDVVEIKGE